MDYLDRNKQLRQHILLYAGYVLLAIAITIAALILVYQAYGFGIAKNGTVIQNGLIFFSSHPNPAAIYVNGKARPQQTNTRMVLQAGIYEVKLTREGYRDWQRTIQLDGGSVEHFDYPFLFPKTLETDKLQDYSALPALLTQSPDRRWIVVSEPGNINAFRLYDLKDPLKPVITTINLPDNLLAKAAGSQAWSQAEWAADNKHVLLAHEYDGKTEYLVLDREQPGQSQNLNTVFNMPAGVLSLRDKKYDQYYLYDAASAELRVAALADKTVEPLLDNVLAYKSYGNDTMLYVTGQDADKGKVSVKLKTGSDPALTVRSLPAGSSYLLDLTKYSGTLYVVASAANTDRVYIYKDPAGQAAQEPEQSIRPVQVLHVTQPSYVSFSNSAQFIMAEGGGHFGVYDIENKVGYNYRATLPIDQPQTHVSWMDGNRLTFVSGGQLTVRDYDNVNQQSLMAAASTLPVAFSPDYNYVFAISQNAAGVNMSRTALVTPADE